MATEVTWFWNFGDGLSSNEQNPTHIYEMPGTYEVTVEVTDSNGTTVSGSFEIYVYNYDYGSDSGSRGAIPSLTNKCYRLPVRPGDGHGPSEYRDSDNPGFDWIWPPSEKGTALAYDENQMEIALALDAKTQIIYQLNNPDMWRDRVGAEYAPGNRIISEMHQKEYEAAAGEHVAIVHNETHSYFEAFAKALKGAIGYKANGLPEDFRVDMQMHKNAEEVYEKKTINVPVDGDIVFQEKLEGRSLQLRVKMYNAPWILKVVQNDFDTIDKAAHPSLREMTESTYQENLFSLPLFHVTRNFNPLFNMATAQDATGTIASLIVGPDERNFSALNFSAGNGLSDTLAENLSGDFTLMAWFKDMPTLPVTLWNIGDLTIRITAGYELEIDDLVNPVITQELSYDGSLWTHFVIVRESFRIRVYENKELLGQFDLASIENYGSTFQNIAVAEGSVFDSIVIPRALGGEIEYYYDDVLRGGNEVLLDF